MPEVKYIKIMNELKSLIDKGVLTPGDILPSENTLSEQFNASRMSVRKGLALLAERGYTHSFPGKGHFVCKPRMDEYTLTFNEDDFIKTYVDRIHLHKVDVIPTSVAMAEKLKIAPNMKIIVIERILYSGEEPIAYDYKCMPYDKGKPLVEEELHYATFPEIVAQKASLFSVRKELKFWAQPAPEEAKELLELHDSSPIMILEQICTNANGNPLVWGKLMVKCEYIKLLAVSSLQTSFDA